MFRRADLTAIMGGVEVDLRGASTGQEAVIDVFAWWGGIEITVPPDWAVSNRSWSSWAAPTTEFRHAGRAQSPGGARVRRDGRRRDQDVVT